MKYLFKTAKASSLFLILFIASCSSTSTVKQKIDTDGKLFAIAYSDKIVNTLCHSHVGATIFGNFEKAYEFQDQLYDLIVTGYSAGLNEVGVENQSIKVDSAFIDNIEYSTWDGKPTVKGEALDILKDFQRQGFQYLLFPRIMSSSKTANEECVGPTLRTGKNNYGIPLVHAISAVIFDTSNGAYIGNAFVSNDFHEVSEPKDFKSISSEEIKYYGNMIREFAKSSAINFIQKVKTP